jgi:long-chain acyl-CoA synthetase
MSCVIGVPDPYRVQKVVAFIVLKPGVTASEDEAREDIKKYLEKHVAKYEMPREINFRESLPKTLVGKVAYRKLEEEVMKEYAAKNENSEESGK